MIEMSTINLRGVTDCNSRFSDDFFTKQMSLVGTVHLGLPKINMKLESGQIKYKKQELENINALVKERLHNEPQYVYKLIHTASILDNKLGKLVQEIDQMIIQNLFDFEKINKFINDCIYYTAHRVKHSVNIETIKQYLLEITSHDSINGKELSNSLFCDIQIPMSMSYYAYYHVMLIGTAIEVAKGRYNPFKLFKYKAAFLDTRTIHPSMIEDEKYLLNVCNQYITEYGIATMEDMVRTIYTEYFTAKWKNQLAMDYVVVNRHLCETILPDQFMSFCYLINYVITFEERKHYWRIKLFQILRLVSEAYGLNIMETSIDDLLQKIKETS